MGIIEIKKLEFRFSKIIELINDKKKMECFTSDDIIYIKSEIKDHYDSFLIMKRTVNELGRNLPIGTFDEHIMHLESFTTRTKKLLEKK